jgi:hypothetical protein
MEGGDRGVAKGSGSMGQKPLQAREAQIKEALNGGNQNITDSTNGTVMERKQDRKDMMAELIKNQSELKAFKKERIFTYAPIMKGDTVGVMSAENATREENDIVESERKRMRDGRNKEIEEDATHSETCIGQNLMQIDDSKGERQKNTLYQVNDETTQKNHFLTAGPGSQACREQ